METFLGEIIVLAIVILGGAIGLKIFSVKKPSAKPKEKTNIFSDRHTGRSFCGISNSRRESSKTMHISSWNINILNKNGDILRSVAIPLAANSYEQVTIGRDPDDDVVINDMTVTRTHGIIRNVDGEYILSDNNSENGLVTFNGNAEQMHDEIKLSDNLVVYFGCVPVAFTKSNSRNNIKISGRDYHSGEKTAPYDL